MPATISVNFATQAEVESVSAPSNKSVSASVLRSVLGSGGVAGGYVTLGTVQTIAGAKTFSAAVTLNTAPTLNAHAATKKYVDDNAYVRRYYYNITGATSTVSGNDSNGNALNILVSTNVDVFRNGILLVQGPDYSVNASTNTITFTTALAAGAQIQVNVGGVGSVPNTSAVNQIVAGTGIGVSGTGVGTVTVSIPNASDPSWITSLNGSKITNNSITPQKLSQPLTRLTAQATTSGPNIEFTGIPSWAKRITFMFRNMSTTGSSRKQIQLGTATGYVTTGYSGSITETGGSVVSRVFSTGLGFEQAAAADSYQGIATFVNLSGNVWVGTLTSGLSNVGSTNHAATSIELPAQLDRIRLTTVNGTDTFDAGLANIMYEG
jgi:hypothetical protein